jgi:16S rRNA (cytidine1402-2'-O)-methyltransferase
VNESSPTGTLYVVATPIGNLEDLSFRALRILRQVHLIAAEDTRRTAKLLAHYQIQKSTVSLREHNEARQTPRLLDRLSRGESIALVSDAGTPGIADPGARLVRAARDRGLPVAAIPGPSAITAALSVSGLSADAFVFMGFPPSGGSERRGWLERLATEDRAIVFFEAPHRLLRTVSDTRLYLAERQIIAIGELSKINEKFINCHNYGDITDAQARGEFVLLVYPKAGTDVQSVVSSGPTDVVGRIADCSSFSDSDQAKMLAALAGYSVRHASNVIKKHKISIKRQNRT